MEALSPLLISALWFVSGTLGFLLSVVLLTREGAARPIGVLRVVASLAFLLASAVPAAEAAARSNLVFPTFDFLVMLGLGVVFAEILGIGLKNRIEDQIGFRWVVSGFWLLFLSKVISVADLCGIMSSDVGGIFRGVALVAGLAGMGCLGIGFANWMPAIAALASERLKLKVRKDELEEEVERRTEDLQREVEQRRAAEAAARQGSEAKSKFLANMSHELRSPLNAVIGFSDLLMGAEAQRGPDIVRQHAKDINEAGKHLLDVVNDVLDIAKIESGRMTVNLEPIDFGSAVSSIARIAQGWPQTAGIDFRVGESDGLTVLADQRAVKQILLNLLSNAVKFTPRGGSVDVEVRVAGENVEVAVKDTGKGIPDDKLEAVFQPFEQVDNAYSKNEGGTGLGLAISRKLAEMMGGTIRLSSALGEGTTALLTLPLDSRLSAAA
jgi:signal transduction histidine kinase